jgi:hypothetical protein
MKPLKQQIMTWLLAGALGLAFAPAAMTEQVEGETSATTGSGDRYKTTITEVTRGELKPEDSRQVSVLGSRVLVHVNNAARFLDKGSADEAKTELGSAQTLIKLVREILPVTTVSTSIKDTQNSEVYRYEDRVQDDQIPIIEGLINIDVVQPLVDAKKEQANLKGVKLADVDLIHTAVLLDLAYVEGKIVRALEHLNEPEKARSELVTAVSNGIRFTLNKKDDPLVRVQSALRLAEQQVREGKHEGAKANLAIARVQLDAYRTVVGDASATVAVDLEKEIAALEDRTREAGAADKIREFWNRVSGWFTLEPGTARQTTEGKEAPKDSDSKEAQADNTKDNAKTVP